MSDNYARCLFEQGDGWPVFNPKPFDDLPEVARRFGTQIGDVGIITPDGSFDPVFNILLPADDPANRFGVPRDFTQAVLRPDDIRIRERCYPPGALLSNKTVHKRCISVQATLETNVQHRLFPIGAGAVVELSTHSKQMGLLVLPDGASSWDARSQQTLHDYAVKHARNWYAFVNGNLQRMVGNGGLYLVTGVTKSTSWCIAATDDSAGDRKVSLLLKATQFGGASATRTWEWETSSSAVHSGPSPGPGEEGWRDNQTLFIRGFKVALGPVSKTAKVVSILKSTADTVLSTSTAVLPTSRSTY
ncbi:hypothetical protein B0H13DRAFT_1635027 [Mycena leptocephala]|nr:hypothetical protein B0H13DRAFT_1635027 [Mycena leptocephala]